MLRVGVVGFGFMGRMHHRCWSNQPGARVTAICEKRLDLVRESAAAGNIAGASEKVDLTDVELFDDFDAMLASGKIDAISLTLPTFLHAGFTVKALESGLHVLCEKPMALSVAECDLMIEAARKAGRRLQVGHCVRFWPEYAKAREIVRSGEYGRPLAASFRRFGAAPSWGDANWFNDDRRSGGMALDLHIHDTDYILWLFGMPKAVCSAFDRGESYMVTRYAYEGLPVTAEGSWGLMPSFGFEMSFNILLERATITYDCTRKPAFRVCPAKGDAFSPEVAAGDGYSREVDHFVRALRDEAVEEVITPGQSRETIRVVLAEKESARGAGRIAL
jgi:1,5-anhydro-D-fructose reductase (1,5-anhydro-D-mannitol-forming)